MIDISGCSYEELIRLQDTIRKKLHEKSYAATTLITPGMLVIQNYENCKIYRYVTNVWIDYGDEELTDEPYINATVFGQDNDGAIFLMVEESFRVAEVYDKYRLYSPDVHFMYIENEGACDYKQFVDDAKVKFFETYIKPAIEEG